MRRRILLLVAGVTTLVVLAFAIPVGVLLNSAVGQRAEHATIDQAQAVAQTLSSASLTDTQIRQYVTSLSESTGRPTSVLTASGEVIGTYPDEQMPAGLPGGGERPGDGGPGPNGPANFGPAQATLQSVRGGQIAQTLAHGTAQNYLVRVFLSNSALHAGEGKWWTLLVAGSAGLLILSIVAGEIITRRIVRPLTRTAVTAHQLSTGDTAARAPTTGPREVAEMGTALNRLADRIDELIAEERETVADLSHRLRTPLTALRLDAEALHDPAEAERVGSHVSALERTLTAVIHAARRPQREGRMPACDATAVVGDRVTFWGALADDQARVRSVQLPDRPVMVRASSDDLGAAVDALVENVIAHTPEGVAFAVRLWEDEGVHLQVSDEGPGLPPDAMVRGRSDRGSSGLGLDIARRCAEAGGGSMTMSSAASGGAIITLHLARP